VPPVLVRLSGIALTIPVLSGAIGRLINLETLQRQRISYQRAWPQSDSYQCERLGSFWCITIIFLSSISLAKLSTVSQFVLYNIWP